MDRPVWEVALEECKDAARPLVPKERLSVPLFEVFADEFTHDFKKKLEKMEDWIPVREGILARARAIVVLADVFARDAGNDPVRARHLFRAFDIVKRDCKALNRDRHPRLADVSADVVERFQKRFELCSSVVVRGDDERLNED